MDQYQKEIVFTNKGTMTLEDFITKSGRGEDGRFVLAFSEKIAIISEFYDSIRQRVLLIQKDGKTEVDFAYCPDTLSVPWVSLRPYPGADEEIVGTVKNALTKNAVRNFFDSEFLCDIGNLSNMAKAILDMGESFSFPPNPPYTYQVVEGDDPEMEGVIGSKTPLTQEELTELHEILKAAKKRLEEGGHFIHIDQIIKEGVDEFNRLHNARKITNWGRGYHDMIVI